MQEIEQREMQLFRALFEAMPQLAWSALPDGFIDLYNKNWYEYTGTTHEDQQGWGWESVHDPKLLPDIVRQWKHSIETGTPFECEFPLRRADGVYRWFLTRANLILDDDGKPFRWIGINTDIDDQKRASETLEQRVKERTQDLIEARDEAVRATELKSQFVANISHEIRTPLSGILGLSELLARETEGEVKETADHILASARSLMQLINDLLDLSKLDAGKIEMNKQLFRIDQIVDDVLTSVYISASSKKLHLSQDIDKALMVDVSGDGKRVGEVLQKLVQNAVKFTEDGSIKLSAKPTKQEQNVIYVCFSVTDTGPGISPENQKKLFQLFVQLDGSSTRKHGGTGIGLAWCKRMVELLNGAIGFDSTPGAGSTFGFTVPLELAGRA